MRLRIVTFGEGWPDGRALPTRGCTPVARVLFVGCLLGLVGQAEVRNNLEKPLVALRFMLQSFQAGRGFFDVFFLIIFAE